MYRFGYVKLYVKCIQTESIEHQQAVKAIEKLESLFYKFKCPCSQIDYLLFISGVIVLICVNKTIQKIVYYKPTN